MKNKLEVIDKSEIKTCWVCDGTGYRKNICNEKYACDACPIKPCKNKCNACNGTGKWREPNYFMVIERNGQKIAFQSDFIK